MELKICMNKNFCTPRDVARVIWENMLLAKELEFIYQTVKIGTEIIKPKELEIEFINKTVCDFFSVPVEMLNSNTRKREIVQARQISMFFAKNLTKNSLAIIGSEIGDKDHATVLHACKTVNNLIDTDKRFRLQISELESKFKSVNFD